MSNIALRGPSQDIPPQTHGLWSLWDMLHSYLPIYEIAIELQKLRRTAALYKDGYSSKLDKSDAERFQSLLKAMQRDCLALGLIPPHEMAIRLIDKGTPESHAIMFADLDHLDGSLKTALKKEAVFSITPERKDYFEQDDLFGPKANAAFPSCERDIRKAGSCYALAQEDACVHHLMLVLERGLEALATRVDVKFHYTDWKKLIDLIEAKLKSGAVPRGPELDFYRDVNAQFGFLKEAYRKHSAHARDDFYDMPKALHIFNHVKEFMQALAQGGLADE